MAGIQTGLTDAQLLASQLKAHELVGQDLATQADLDALALSSGNLTTEQIAMLGNLENNADSFIVSNNIGQILFDAIPKESVAIDKILKIKTMDIELDKMNINTTATGREGSGSTDIIVNGDGLTHPKMIYVENGWNGYKYWLGATPYFGVVGINSEYENPHVFASNDLITWVEPYGGKIDSCDIGTSHYLSDTHLMLGSDSFLYCFYRDNTNTARKYYYKKSSDGIVWSKRFTIFDTDNITNVSKNNIALSPAFINKNNSIEVFDIMRSSGNLIIPSSTTCTSSFVMKRFANNINDIGGFQEVNVQQVCRYDTRLWGNGIDPWHIDTIKTSKFYIQLINTGEVNGTDGSSLFLAYSLDGFNYKGLGEYEYYGEAFFYRSSLTLISETETDITMKMVVAKKNGELSLVNLVVGV